MYQALYRKWRPQTFDEVIGQEHITETLKNQVMNRRLSHAYLFIGTRGTGKTTCARILAKAVNCEHPVNGNPCCQCASCRGIADGSIMDVVELDAASNNGVDNVRALREEAVFSPSAVRKRVYIVDEVHMLSASAFNALLKIIEEPPEHLMFILATTELQKVPATILSRCQRHNFRRIETGTLSRYLLRIAGEEHFDLTEDAAALLARLAEGGARDALSLLDQCSGQRRIDTEAVYSAMGLAGKKRMETLFELVAERETEKAVSAFHSLWMEGKDPGTVLGELLSLCRDILLLRVAPKGGMELVNAGHEPAMLRRWASQLTAAELRLMMETIQRALASLREAKSPKTAAELCLISLCEPSLSRDMDAFDARLSRLEEQAARADFSAPVSRREEPSPVPAFAVEDEPPEEAPPLPEEPSFYEESPFYEEAESSPPPAWAESDPVSEEPPSSPPAAERSAPPAMADAPVCDWTAVKAGVMPLLPIGTQMFLRNESAVRGSVRGSVVVIEAEPAVAFGLFNRSNITKIISDYATELAGVQVNVLVKELMPEEKPRRSIDDLKNFPETRIIG